PVRAKMEGRWQRSQSLPGLPAHLYDLFPDRLVESELGEIPEGWQIVSLSCFSALNPESWTKQTRPAEILYVDLSNTKWGRIESITRHSAADSPSRAQRVLRPLDSIIGTVRPGNGSYALISEEGLTGSTGFAVLRPLRREYSEFVYLAATAHENIERLSNLADGGAYPAIRPEIVSATKVPRADEELINEFSRQVGSMLARVAENERESRTLAALRDTLLPKLISGELRVKDAEAFLKERGL
ncbi:MAG: restriction endonuclease subunit S, partial [Myxococcota bacterium]|nr:restriction endonuclease subunit S [Myxococcota bacterium]